MYDEEFTFADEEFADEEIKKGKGKFWTVYDGPSGRQLMRSRTEAFAAAWMDLHDVKWRYEPKRTKTGWLPDFWVPSSNLLIDVKGGDIAPKDRDLLFKSAHALRHNEDGPPQMVLVWKPLGADAWWRVEPDDKKWHTKPISAFLCAKCDQWTLGWYVCQTCQTDTGFILEHTGRNSVRDPAAFFGERDCLLATEYFKVSSHHMTVVGIEDVPADVRAAGLVGERSFHSADGVSINDGVDDDDDDDESDTSGQVYYLKVDPPEIRSCL